LQRFPPPHTRFRIMAMASPNTPEYTGQSLEINHMVLSFLQPGAMPTTKGCCRLPSHIPVPVRAFLLHVQGTKHSPTMNGHSPTRPLQGLPEQSTPEHVPSCRTLSSTILIRPPLIRSPSRTRIRRTGSVLAGKELRRFRRWDSNHTEPAVLDQSPSTSMQRQGPQPSPPPPVHPSAGQS
jgi:hypothetical protein